MRDIKVLVVDDSGLMRNVLSQIIAPVEGLTVADKAANGKEALEKIPLSKPDIILLDMQMPIMNGLEFLEERKNQNIDIPVIVLSSVAQEGTALTMQCLELGAIDFISKPSASSKGGLSALATSLPEILLSYGRQHLKIKENKVAVLEIEKAHTHVSTSKNISGTPRTKIEIIAIAISTGGPNSLRKVLADINPKLKQPILIVQHMPEGFTKEFAISLNKICPLEVREATDGEVVSSGRVYIAPGNKHMYVKKKTFSPVIYLSDDEPRNGHRPSADVLFESIVTEYKDKALGVIMTGMGSDGAKQLLEMRKNGARTIGQDEETSVVYGMPRVAYELGAVQKQVSLCKMAETISSLAMG